MLNKDKKKKRNERKRTATVCLKELSPMTFGGQGEIVISVPTVFFLLNVLFKLYYFILYHYIFYIIVLFILTLRAVTEHDSNKSFAHAFNYLQNRLIEIFLNSIILDKHSCIANLMYNYILIYLKFFHQF